MTASRPTIDDLTDVVLEVIAEVHATTPVRLEWRPGFGILAERPGSVGGVVHVAGTDPDPDWVEPMDRRVSAPVEWDVGPGRDPVFPPDTRLHTMARVTDEVSDLVQVELWRLRLDATWPACPAHPGTHPLRISDELWTCRSGSAVVGLGALTRGRPLLRRTPLPVAGPDAVAAAVGLVLADVRSSIDLDLVFVVDPADPRRGEVVPTSAPERRVEVDASLQSDVSDWIWELPPEERPIEIPEGQARVFEEQTIGITLWQSAYAVVGLVRDLLDDAAAAAWPACPAHPGEHRLELSDSMGNGDDSVLWWCVMDGPVAFVGELQLE